MEFDVNKLTNAQLDRLQQRLTARIDERKGEKERADRERYNPTPLRPHIGNAGIGFANELARRNWDIQCIEFLRSQTVPYTVAPMTSVLARDGKRLAAGQEFRPMEHLNALQGAFDVQVEKLVSGGFLLAKENVP